jgi:hypothetical protein
MSENQEATTNQVQDISKEDINSTENINTETSQYSEIEKKAMEMGWDPNHEGKTFVPAEEYVNRAPLFQRIEQQNRELKELKNLQKQMAQHMSAVRKESYEQALKDLENKKLQAVDSGDRVTYEQAESQAVAIRTKMASDPITTHLENKPEISQETLEWVNKNNTWYNDSTIENRKMKAAAEAIDTFLTNQARIDQNTANNEMPNINLKEHFKAVEKEVERLFPHRFKNMNREQPNSVGKSTTGTSGSITNTGLVSRLTQNQRLLGERFQKSNPEYTLEKYAADLDAMGRLNK